MSKNSYLEGLINTLELGLDFNILTEEAVKELEEKIAFQKTVIGRINYIGPKGNIVESTDFTNKEWMDKTIFEQQNYGVPMTYEYYDIESEEVSSEPETVILVERDYKGTYERFALTPENFREDYSEFLAEAESSGSFTIQPMVHIWFQTTTAKSAKWNEFFTDMTSGLPEADVEAGNTANIRKDMFSPELIKYL